MKSRRTNLWSWAVALGAAGALFSLTGCEDAAFCYRDCDGPSLISGAGGGSGGEGGTLFSSSSGEGGCLFNCGEGGAGGAGGCMQTNGGIEICDGVDNNCNSKIDDLEGLDLTKPQTCGTCKTNCYTLPTNWDPTTVKCAPSPDPGKEPGTCSGSCDSDYYDLNGDGSCEFYCIKTAPDDSLCNNKDDDCDGQKDEDVDLCTSVTDCGKCGANCVVLNGSPKCVNDGQMPCGPANTACAIDSCKCNGPGDCWWDIDGVVLTGCEYNCDLSNGGVEVCDGLDNDCDGKVDGADDLSADSAVGGVCYGSPLGECGNAAHAGTGQCIGGQVICTGANVLKPNDVLETCNGKDDDCDGAVDDSPTDAGTVCGTSNIAPCAFGTKVCTNGSLVCVGAVDPKVETCNGIDDDCDGTPDKTNGNPPADSMGACNVPTPPPAGATSPCMAGAKACTGGIITCQGAVGPTGPTDTCGVDANCDGQLTNQPDKNTDINNCGACGNGCYANAVHSVWSCVAGACVFGGCENGYYDLNNDQKCEYPCLFNSAQESCNGVDDNCNGQIDEGVVAPSPTQVCGVSVTASTPECTSNVTVACMAGAWKCTFPAGVCSPTCAGASEVCDTLDNNCNGVLNENVANYGKPCASDDANPNPGDGACRTTGTYTCNGPNATACSAVKANCVNLPGGCTELCDGVDNDCDGLTDEAFNQKGPNAANFVKPVVTKIAAASWIFTYEASRPNATNVAPGTGNGYWTSAPVGTTLDKTRACSAPTKVPWFNVTPTEVTQTCLAMGGSICSTNTWISACQPNAACKWGYNPRGAAGSACATSFTGSKYCNLGVSYDFDPGSQGTQNGLLPTASGNLQNCWGDWSALQGNVAATNKLYDLTGNLREIVFEAANDYRLMGGAFNSQAEDGAQCTFKFSSVVDTFKFYDTGFRCCFTSDPTL